MIIHARVEANVSRKTEDIIAGRRSGNRDLIFNVLLKIFSSVDVSLGSKGQSAISG